MISLLIASILRRQGWHVSAALNVAATMATACMLPTADVMLLDMHFPDGTAEDVLRQLSALPQLASVPVVLMTGAGRDELEAVLEYPSVVAVLAKPVNAEELVEMIERVLGGTLFSTSRDEQ